MSDKNEQKLAEKEAKAAAKAALKEKKERVKQNKPKKDENAPNIFVRIGKAIARFFKDFRGTVKKIVWPDRKTVLKSTGVVLAVVLVIGAGIWIADWALGGSIGLIRTGVESLREDETGEETTVDEHEGHDHDDDDLPEDETTAAAGEDETSAAGEDETGADEVTTNEE